MAVDWDEIGTLSSTVGGYDIRTDPLWILVISATQGHEGTLDQMHIRMANGKTYSPNGILALAHHPDRKLRRD